MLSASARISHWARLHMRSAKKCRSSRAFMVSMMRVSQAPGSTKRASSLLFSPAAPSRSCVLAQRRNGGGNHVAEAVLVADVPLALHAEAGDAVPGQLGQQHAADALDQKREGHVFQHAFVPHAHQLFQKSLLILPGHLLHQLVHIAPGIAQPGSQRDLRLRVRRVAQKKHPLLALRHGLSPSP